MEAQRRTLDLLLPVVRAIRCNHSLRYIANVIDGTYDAFVYHSLSLWDIVGPAVLLAEAGATVTRTKCNDHGLVACGVQVVTAGKRSHRADSARRRTRCGLTTDAWSRVGDE